MWSGMGTIWDMPLPSLSIDEKESVSFGNAQRVEKRPVQRMVGRAQNAVYKYMDRGGKGAERCRFVFHFASFLRFMAANLSLAHLETWTRPL